jgi:ribulose-5-phosphate 4-epimerase/fuculose-1-phosphate aldolase
VCALEDGLLPISMNSTAFAGKLSCHEYEGPTLDLDERERLLDHLGDNQAMLLRNHGLLVTGRSVPDAFLRLYRLERACQVQIDAASAGRLHVLDRDVARKSGAGMDAFSERESRNGAGDLEFAALLRKLDRSDPQWRH